MPVDDLRAAVDRALAREGADLATYGLQSGPQGYRPCREFVARKLKTYCGIETSADDILLTSGSLQGMDLVNRLLLQEGDTVIVEESNYGGAFTKLRALGVNMVAVPLDEHGMRWTRWRRRWTIWRPGASGQSTSTPSSRCTIRPERSCRWTGGTGCWSWPGSTACRSSRMNAIPIVWSNERPPALRALDDSGMVIHRHLLQDRRPGAAVATSMPSGRCWAVWWR